MRLNLLDFNRELYLFNNGVWSNLQITGFTMILGGMHKYDTNDYWEFQYDNVGRLKQSINLSAYKYVICEISVNVIPTTDYVYLSVSQNPNINTHTGYTATQSFLPNTTNWYLMQLDISKLTGDYFIYIHRNKNVMIRKVYLSNH